MTTTRDLISRLEKATGPDREIDEALFEIAHGRKRHRSTFEQYEPSERLPIYTKSIDDALMLVPDEWTAWQLRSRRRKTAWVAELSRLGDDIDEGEEYVTGHSPANPAIALCIAALKARLAMAEKD